MPILKWIETKTITRDELRFLAVATSVPSKMLARLSIQVSRRAFRCSPLTLSRKSSFYKWIANTVKGKAFKHSNTMACHLSNNNLSTWSAKTEHIALFSAACFSWRSARRMIDACSCNISCPIPFASNSCLMFSAFNTRPLLSILLLSDQLPAILAAFVFFSSLQQMELLY